MNTRTKIQIDRMVGQPLLVLANLAARFLGRVLRRDHTLEPAAVRTVVVSKFVGMGSILQATPLLRSLRASFPEARIVFVTARSNALLMPHLADVDRAIYVDEGGLLRLARTSLAAAWALVRLRADAYLDLEVYSSYACLMSLASLARNRAGFYRTSTRFKLGIYTHLVFFNASKPIREVYLQLGRAVGAGPLDDVALSPLCVDAAERARFAERWRELAGARADEAPVVVNANASDLLEERRWPLSRFVETIHALVERGRLVVLSGAPSEAAWVGELVERLDPDDRRHVVDASGRLSLAGFLVLLERAALVITNDSGPMHMAFALGRPTVGLFGPGDPRHYGVVQPGVELVHRPIFCSPCLYHADDPPCAGDNVCMQLIRPEEVLAAAERVEQPGHRPAPLEPHDAVSEPALAEGQPLGTIVRDSILGPGLVPCPCCAGRRFTFRFRREGFRFIRCARCGLERIDPAPSDDELAAIYRREYYGAWGLEEEPEETARMKRQSFARLLRRAQLPVPGARERPRLLDFGAATGFLMDAARELGFDAYGIEINEFGAKEIAARHGHDHVFCGEAEEARFPALEEDEAFEGFDGVMMTDYIEHVRDPAGVLRKAHALLAPGGRIVVTTPDTGSLSHRFMGRNWLHYKTEHLYYFSRRNLCALLASAGFEGLEARGARKVLSVRYVAHVLLGYPHWLLTPLARLALRVLPDALLDGHFSVPSGELEIRARKRG